MAMATHKHIKTHKKASQRVDTFLFAVNELLYNIHFTLWLAWLLSSFPGREFVNIFRFFLHVEFAAGGVRVCESLLTAEYRSEALPACGSVLEADHR